MSISKIDICMTATLRPSIIETTLESFTKNMLTDKSRYRLIINIDPIGERVKAKEIVKLANNFFDDVVYNIPTEPGFTKAVQWCWSQTSAEYIFHLEDDWKLLIPINIDSMIEILKNIDNLASLRLNKERTGNSKHSEKHGFIFWSKISLNPTLFKGNFIRGVYPLMELDKNPEKQLRISHLKRNKISDYLSKFYHGIYTKESGRQIVFDIGAKWMYYSNYKKRIGFMKWEKV
jgi:hypothetical protein